MIKLKDFNLNFKGFFIAIGIALSIFGFIWVLTFLLEHFIK